MKRCKCGSKYFRAPFEVVADYEFDGDFQGFDLLGICFFPEHIRCGNITCSGCGKEYESENDIPDAEEENEKV